MLENVWITSLEHAERKIHTVTLVADKEVTVLKVSFKESTLLRKRRCFPKLWEIFPLKPFQAWNCCLRRHISQVRRTLCSTIFQNAKSLVWPQVVRPLRSAPGSNEGCWQMWISSYEVVQRCFPVVWRDVDCSLLQCSGLFFSLENIDVGWYRQRHGCGIYTGTEKCSESYWDVCAKKRKSVNSRSNVLTDGNGSVIFSGRYKTNNDCFCLTDTWTEVVYVGPQS